MQLVRVLEVRSLPYSLDIAETNFTAEDYVELLLLLLRSRFAARVAFRACNTLASPWLRQRAFVFLRLSLPGGCVDDGLLPHAAPHTDPKEEADLSSRLIEQWLRPCHVRPLPPLHCASEAAASSCRALRFRAQASTHTSFSKKLFCIFHCVSVCGVHLLLLEHALKVEVDAADSGESRARG